MKKVHSVYFCGLLAAMTVNQVLAMQSMSTLITRTQILENTVARPKLNAPEIAAYLTKKTYPGDIELKIYALIPYIHNPAHGSPTVLVNLLEIMDYIYDSIISESPLSIDEIIEQARNNPAMRKIDLDTIAYMYYLMTEEDKLNASDEEMLEALCDTNALKKFKFRNMQKAYLEKKGYTQDTVNTGLELLGEYTATCGLISDEPEKFLALLVLVDWMRDKAIKNPEALLSEKQITIMMIELKNELPNVYAVLNNNILELNDMIKNLHYIINEITYENMDDLSPEEQNLLQDKIVLEALEFDLETAASQLEQEQIKILHRQGYSNKKFVSELQNMQEYTNCFKSVFKTPEMFNPLFDVINKAIFYLNPKSNKGELSLGELIIKIKQNIATNNVDEGIIMQIHYLITEKNIRNKDEIIAELDAMNNDAREYDIITHPKGFELFDCTVEHDSTISQNYQLSSPTESFLNYQ